MELAHRQRSETLERIEDFQPVRGQADHLLLNALELCGRLAGMMLPGHGDVFQLYLDHQ